MDGLKVGARSKSIMETIFHFYMFPDLAAQHLQPEGKRVGHFWHELTAKVGSELYSKVERTHRELTTRSPIGKGLVAAWRMARRYSKGEIDNAVLFHMGPPWNRHPAISHESAYDSSAACPHCGAGRKQTKPLEINLPRLPKRAPLVCTGTFEWLVPESVADLLQEGRFTGFRLRSVVDNREAPSGETLKSPTLPELESCPSGAKLLREARQRGLPIVTIGLLQFVDMQLWHKALREYNQSLRPRRLAKPVQPWYQLEVVSRPVAACPPTKFGIGPFDDDEEGLYRCPLGHRSGLNLMSEIFVRAADWDGSDIVATSNLVGAPIPHPLLLVSPRFRSFWTQQKLRGVFFDVAYLTT